MIGWRLIPVYPQKGILSFTGFLLDFGNFSPAASACTPHHKPNLSAGERPRHKNLLCLPTTAMPPSLRTSPLFTQTVPLRKKCIIHKQTVTLGRDTNIKQSPQPTPDLLLFLPTFPLLLTSTTPLVSQPTPRSIIWSSTTTNILRNQELQGRNISPIHRDILLSQSTTSTPHRTNQDFLATATSVILPLRIRDSLKCDKLRSAAKCTQSKLPTTTRQHTTRPTHR